MNKPIKAWALFEDGKLCHNYALAYIVFSKRQAKIEQLYKNKIFDHKMEVVPVEIRVKPR